MKTFIFTVASLLTGICIGNVLSDNRRMLRQTLDYERDTLRLWRVDTVTRIDTLRIPVPTYIERRAIGSVTVGCDQVIKCDSDSLTLGRESRVYADSTFRAVVSGVDPRLDSLTLLRPRSTITQSVTNTIHTPARITSRWGIGITAGATLSPRGITPGITLGVTYRLWR